MVYVLKNIAIRIWIASAVGGLATLGLLALLGSPLETSFNLVVVAILTILAYFCSGWALNRIASSRLQDCLREATSRERTSRIGEAAEAFEKAIILFDSFLVSPLFRRKMGRELAGRIARFHIARAALSPEAENFIASYLWAYPDDAEVAEYWLQHTGFVESANPEHMALADRIAATQPANLTIHGLIANTYLARHRTDYTALQIYRRFLQESEHSQDPAVVKLADLFQQEGRSDEWALEVYLKAHTQHPDRTDYLKGLAACMNQLRETDRYKPLFTAARDILRDIDKETIQLWQASFRQTTIQPTETKQVRTVRILASLYRFIRQCMLASARAIRTITSNFMEWFQSIGRHWNESPRTRYIAKWVAVSIFAAVVIISGISTVYYIRETKESPDATSAPAEPEPQIATSGRYTVQAASFRTSLLAKDFVNRLNQLGYSAYSGESRSAEDIWYYVRISRFETKQEAREFAEELKSKGIIEDFYIANYKEP
jgi:hypothetical protein